MKLIGVYGLARSGKDTIGSYLVENYNYKRYAFADPLKKACSEMFGVALNYFYDDDLKEVEIPFWGFSPRRMAQLLGTEGARNVFRKDIWIKRAESEWIETKELNFYSGMVVTDVRFDNEIDWIKHEGGILIKVTRPGVEGAVTSHSSETLFDDSLFDYAIHNNGTLDDLYNKVNVILSKDIK